MKRGVVGGIAVCLFLVASWVTCATTVYVNDRVPSLDRPFLEEGGSILVPIEGFGRVVGIETTVERDRLILRWSGGRRDLSSGWYAVREGVPYASLEWMVGLVGGEIHRVGETWYVETTVALLEEIEATADRVVLRFNGFVPIEAEASADGAELRLVIDHCRPAIAPRLTVLGGGIDSIRLQAETSGRVAVRITLQEETIIRTEAYESPGFYSLCVEVAARPESEAIVQVDEGLVLHRLTIGSARADWLYVEAWRDRYRLVPAFPSAGFETLASIESLADSAGAVAAVNLGCSRTSAPVELLVIGGVPYVVDGRTHDGLGLDLFSWWTYFSADAAVYAKHGGGRIPMNDVNRSILYGEVIAYPPGYVGTIARGVPGSFTVVKVRSERVVSVYEGPFVTADPTATLLVASGEAKARLSLVRLGDALSLECAVGAEGVSFDHAFSAGPVLVDSGVHAPNPESPSLDSPSGWSVLATDWHGGLILLSFVRETATETEILGDLIDLLASMPVPIRDAIVLGRCGENALVARNSSSVYRMGSGDPYALALCLVPLAP